MLKVLQWNIGGGKIRRPEDRVEDGDAYSEEGMDHIVGIVRNAAPDIVSLQEATVGLGLNQAQEIADAAGLPHCVFAEHSDSHITPGAQAALAVLSRFPIKEEAFSFLPNPNLEITRPDGAVWKSFDKGMLRCTLDLPEQELTFTTLHLLPFFLFGADPAEPRFRDLMAQIARQLESPAPAIIAGDFNLPTALEKFFPGLMAAGFAEAPVPASTYYRGTILDRALYRGSQLRSLQVVQEALADHFPVLAEFDI